MANVSALIKSVPDRLAILLAILANVIVAVVVAAAIVAVAAAATDDDLAVQLTALFTQLTDINALLKSV